eukprot:13092007-Alexandrium_andersonii.AAC.1
MYSLFDSASGVDAEGVAEAAAASEPSSRATGSPALAQSKACEGWQGRAPWISLFRPGQSLRSPA